MARPTRLMKRTLMSNNVQASGIDLLVHDATRLRRVALDNALRCIGMTRSQWWILANLIERSGEGLTQTELAKALGVGKVVLGGFIDRLETAGMVCRCPDALDRRVHRIVTTPLGIRRFSEAQSLVDGIHAQIWIDIPSNDVRKVAAVLQSLRTRLIALQSAAGGQTSLSVRPDGRLLPSRGARTGSGSHL